MVKLGTFGCFGLYVNGLFGIYFAYRLGYYAGTFGLDLSFFTGYGVAIFFKGVTFASETHVGLTTIASVGWGLGAHGINTMVIVNGDCLDEVWGFGTRLVL